MELKKLWEIVCRRKWIIVQAFVIILATSIVSSFLIIPKYESTSKLLFTTSDTASSLLESIGLSSLTSLFGSSDAEVKTHIELAITDPVLERLISLLQIRDRYEDLLVPEKLLRSNILISMILAKPKLKLEEIEDTDLIEIRSTSSDPKEAAMMANTLSELFMEDNLKRRRAEYRSARTFIENQIDLARVAYLEALEEMKDFKVREKSINLQAEIKLAIEKMAELMEQKEDNIIDIAEINAKTETLKIQLDRQNEEIVSSVAISENPQIENLKKNILDMEFKLVGMLTEKTSEHIDVKILKQKIKKAKDELKNEMNIFRETSKDLQLLERELAALKVHLENVNSGIDKYLALLYTLPEKESVEAQLKLRFSASQEVYSSLLDYFYQVRIAEAMTISEIMLVESAVETTEPVSPNKVLNGVLGLFFGLIFGFALAFLIDYLDDTIKTPEDAKKHGGFTYLGTIPRFKRKENVLISEKRPNDLAYESYRTIRNNIRFSSLNKPLSSLLITSAFPGEGKTVTSANMSISISREGINVLLVDLDLRRSGIHKLFGLSNAVGVVNLLAGEVKIEDAVNKTSIQKLHVLTAGPIPPDPIGMIESEKMKQLIRDLTQQYDFIVLDTPPILASNDAVVLARYADSSLIVSESGKATFHALTEIKRILEHANVHPIGMVLNKLKLGRGGGEYYYYYYKGGYYQDEKK